MPRSRVVLHGLERTGDAPPVSLSFLSSLLLIGPIWALIAAESLLAIVYMASLCATLAYHASGERDWHRWDQACAVGVIASNTWMVWHARSWLAPLAGIACVCVALRFFWNARACRDRYDLSHALWHVFSAIAGYIFVLGYAN